MGMRDHDSRVLRVNGVATELLPHADCSVLDDVLKKTLRG